jgi:Fe-S cluster biogenesis protein NfuA
MAVKKTEKKVVAKQSKKSPSSKVAVKAKKSPLVSEKKKISTRLKSSKKKAATSSLSITERVEQVLDTLRPYLISDGGNIELLGVDETNGIVTVHLVGACASCPSSQVTLYSGVEKALKEQIPQLNSLIAI